jgi:hypothetical protein
MKLKLDEHGNPVLQNAHPVYVNDDGKEVAVDVPKLFGDIKRLNAESASRRKEIDHLTEKLKAFEGIEDPEAARKALETVANLNDKELVDAKKMEELKANMSAAHTAQLAQVKQGYESQLAERDKIIQTKDAQVRNLLVKGAFDASKFLAEKTILPPDMAFNTFGHYFEVEEVNGELRAVAKVNGAVIPSLANPGDPASPEEAIEALIDKYPFKDRILKATGQKGMGTPPGGGGGGSDKKTITRQQFDALGPEARMAHINAGGVVTD